MNRLMCYNMSSNMLFSLNFWRINITSHLKHTILSLFPARTSRVAPARRRSTPATSITRIQAGLPHAHPAGTREPHGGSPRRSARQFTSYARSRYLPHPRHDLRRHQPIFRIG